MKNQVKAVRVVVLFAVVLVDIFAYSAPLTFAKPAVTKSKKLKHKTSFDETVERYPSPYGFLEDLRQTTGDTVRCLDLDDEIRAVVGTNDPMQGQALEKEPGPFLVKKMASCITSSIYTASSFAIVLVGKVLGEQLRNELTRSAFEARYCDSLTKRFTCEGQRIRMTSICESNAELVEKEIDQCVTERMKNNNYSIESTEFMSNKFWRSLSSEKRKRIIIRMIESLVGPEEILAHYKYIGTDNIFEEKIESISDLATFLVEKLIEPALKPGDVDGATMSETNYFGMARVYRELAIVLRLGPALKH